MSLDKENKNVAYLLGRWFAVIEMIQENAGNSTLRDRYYSAVSSNPVSVFGILDRLKNHHLSKLKKSEKNTVYFEKLLSIIIDDLPANLPNSLNLRDQATFAIGYYHQRLDLYTKKEKPESNNPTEKE